MSTDHKQEQAIIWLSSFQLVKEIETDIVIFNPISVFEQISSALFK